MSDALLTTTTMWILHAESLRLGILIQGPKLLPVLMLRLGCLIVTCTGVAVRAGSTSGGGGGIVGEELLGLGESRADLARSRELRGFVGLRAEFAGDCWRRLRHGEAKDREPVKASGRANAADGGVVSVVVMTVAASRPVSERGEGIGGVTRGR